ncbi:S41 family peptidase [soil metagenome]
MKKLLMLCATLFAISGCGGGGGTAGSCNGTAAVCSPSTTVTTPASTAIEPLANSSDVAHQCAVPRPSDTINPDTNLPYGDVQGTLSTEKAWIRAFVNETYLWYTEVPTVNPAPYVVGATVPYVNPSTNAQGFIGLSSNYDVVDAYFNSQRTSATTASGKPKDQFHFTYPTTEWQALSTKGSTVGFGFQLAMVSSTGPRKVVVAYTSPATPAAANNLGRGAEIVSVNGVSVATGTDTTTLNEGLFAPVDGKQYTFVVLDLGAAAARTITMTASNVTSVPVQNARTLPAPNNGVGYIQFNDHIATAENQLIAAVNQLKAANGGAGISDLVLDLRYNGGGYLDVASELAYMIAGPTATTGKNFEQLVFNDKNPFGVTAAQAAVPFHNKTQGFSTTAGQALPHLDLPRVFVVTSSGTCSASEAIINGLRGAGITVIQIGGTTCGKPYGFFPEDNCSTTYFTVQFKGVNNLGFGDYADGFIPGAGAGATNLPGCAVADDFTKQLGDPLEGRLAAALMYRNSGVCPPASDASRTAASRAGLSADPALVRSPLRENRLLRQRGSLAP